MFSSLTFVSRCVHRPKSIVLCPFSCVNCPTPFVVYLLQYDCHPMYIVLCRPGFVYSHVSIILYLSSCVYCHKSMVLCPLSYVFYPVSRNFHCLLSVYWWFGPLKRFNSGFATIIHWPLTELRNQCISAFFFSPISHFVFSKSLLQTYYIIQKKLKKWESSGSVNQRWGPSSLVNRTTSRNYIFKVWLYILYMVYKWERVKHWKTNCLERLPRCFVLVGYPKSPPPGKPPQISKWHHLQSEGISLTEWY